MGKISEKARTRFQYAALLACVVGMLCCWGNAAFHLQGSRELLVEAAAFLGAILVATGTAYAGTSEPMYYTGRE
jgi:hypothetical protein